MSQVGSPSTTARPAPTAPAVTGAAVTPTPTDQATGNAPRHHGGGQSAPQQQPAPHPPAPPAPAVTLAGALIALFSGQPVKATVDASASGQVVLRLPEAQLVIAADAIEAARGDVLVLKLVAATPNPAIIVTGRNGRPVADPAPVPVTIEPVVEQPPILLPPISRRPVLPTALPPLPNVGTSPSPIAGPSLAPFPTAGDEPVSPPPQLPQTRAPFAAPNAPAPPAPPVLAEADLPPVTGEAPVQADVAVPKEVRSAAAPRAPSLLLQVTQPLRAATPAMPPPPVAPTIPSTVHVAAEPAPLPPDELLLMPPSPVTRAAVGAAPPSPSPSPAPAPMQMRVEPAPPVPLRSPMPPIKTEGEAATVRPLPLREQSQSAPTVVTPLPTRRAAEGPVPFVPPAIPPEALRPPGAPPAVAFRMAPPPGPGPVQPRPEAAKVGSDNQPATAPAAPTKSAAPSTPATSATPPELVPIEVEPVPPPDAPLDRRAASAWTALWAAARLDPVAAERIRDMLQPKAGGRLGGGLAFLVSALRGGKLADWLGSDDSARIDRPSRPTGMRTVEAEFRDLARMAQERGPDGWRATPLAVLDGGAVQPVMLYVHRPPRRRKNDPRPEDASERFMLDLKLSRAGPMRIDGLLRPKVLDVIVRTERSVPSRIQRDLRQVFTTSLEGAGLGGTLAFQKVDRLPPPPSMTADDKPHHAVLA